MFNTINLREKETAQNTIRQQSQPTDNRAKKDGLKTIFPKKKIQPEESLDKIVPPDNPDNNAISESPESIEWSAPEFIKYSKPPEWFLVGGLIAAALFLFALFAQNLLFGLIIILAAFSIYIWTEKEPKIIKFAINSKGIKVQDFFYNFDNLKSFGVFNESSESKYIALESKKTFAPKIIIPLRNQDPEKIRDFLSKFLIKEEQEESLIDALARYIRY